MSSSKDQCDSDGSDASFLDALKEVRRKRSGQEYALRHNDESNSDDDLEHSSDRISSPKATATRTERQLQDVHGETSAMEAAASRTDGRMQAKATSSRLVGRMRDATASRLVGRMRDGEAGQTTANASRPQGQMQDKATSLEDGWNRPSSSMVTNITLPRNRPSSSMVTNITLPPMSNERFSYAREETSTAMSSTPAGNDDSSFGGQSMVMMLRQLLREELQRGGLLSTTIAGQNAGPTESALGYMEGKGRIHTGGSASLPLQKEPRSQEMLPPQPKPVVNQHTAGGIGTSSDQQECSVLSNLHMSESQKIKIVDEAWAKALNPRGSATEVREVIRFDFFDRKKTDNRLAETIRHGCRRRANCVLALVLLEVAKKIFGWKRANDLQPVGSIKDIQDAVKMDREKIPDLTWLLQAALDNQRIKFAQRLSLIYQIETGFVVAPEGMDANDPRFKKLKTLDDLRNIGSGDNMDCMAHAMSRKVTERKKTIGDSASAFHGYEMRTNVPAPELDSSEDAGKVNRNRWQRGSRTVYLRPIEDEDVLANNMRKQHRLMMRVAKKVSSNYDMVEMVLLLCRLTSNYAFYSTYQQYAYAERN